MLVRLAGGLLQPSLNVSFDRYKQGRRLLAAGGCFLATPAYVLLRLVTQDTLGHKAFLCVLLPGKMCSFQRFQPNRLSQTTHQT